MRGARARGAAAQTSVLPREKQLLGTPRGMAPAQLWGELDTWCGITLELASVARRRDAHTRARDPRERAAAGRSGRGAARSAAGIP